MPRNMSFFLTQKQFKDKTKTVTRRLGWHNLKVGEVLNGCEKCQGLKKGEKINVMGQIVIVDTNWEPLNFITYEECILEGFPYMTPMEFIDFFCKSAKCQPSTPVNRIQFDYL